MRWPRKTRPNLRSGLIACLMCVDIAKPEPTMSLSRVLHLRIVQKDANLKT